VADILTGMLVSQLTSCLLNREYLEDDEGNCKTELCPRLLWKKTDCVQLVAIAESSKKAVRCSWMCTQMNLEDSGAKGALRHMNATIYHAKHAKSVTRTSIANAEMMRWKWWL
jgi:hypothetical protein